MTTSPPDESEDAGVAAIEARYRFFAAWLAAGHEDGGLKVRGGFAFVCPACGYLCLYFDIDITTSAQTARLSRPAATAGSSQLISATRRTTA